MNIESIQDTIGLPHFQRQELLEIARTHPNFIAEQPQLTPSQQERQSLESIGLAYLGSTVLSVLVSRYLCDRYCEWPEAILTLIKSDLLRRSTLSGFVHQINLKRFCDLGQSYDWKHQFEQDKIMAQIFEAVVGAVYLEFERDLNATTHWLGQTFLQGAVDHFLWDAFGDSSDEIISSQVCLS